MQRKSFNPLHEASNLRGSAPNKKCCLYKLSFFTAESHAKLDLLRMPRFQPRKKTKYARLMSRVSRLHQNLEKSSKFRDRKT